MFENKPHEILKGHLTEKEYLFTTKQYEIYVWLKMQNLNTDDNTLIYWSKKYSDKRIKEVVNFAQSRIRGGQTIKNIGGWVHKLLKTGLAVITDESQGNRKFVQEFVKKNKWFDLKVYEKYVRDSITGDDLPLTIAKDTFERSLEYLFKKSILYKNSNK